MKRTILASIIGIAAAMAVTSAHAQGNVFLDNYDGTGAPITYGAGSGGTVGAGIVGTQWTIGIYGAVGNVTVSADPSGTADPTTLGALTLLSGSPGDTIGLLGAAHPGFFGGAANPAVLPGYSSGASTLMVVAYNGSSYDSSTIRGHSAAITDLTLTTGSTTPGYVSYTAGGVVVGMQTFSSLPTTTIPEPSVFALSSIGAAALMLIRRKK